MRFLPIFFQLLSGRGRVAREASTPFVRALHLIRVRFPVNFCRTAAIFCGLLLGGTSCAQDMDTLDLRAVEANSPGSDPVLRNMFGFNSGVGNGMLGLGGAVRREIAFANVQYGRLLHGSVAHGKPWAGRWMVIGEVTVARELDPGDSWTVSLTPMVRYQFDRGSRWVPFIEGGYGITWTEIGLPDLGGDGQFNGQLGAGVYWFARRDLAFTLQYRFVHYSNAGIRRPNQGVNLNTGLIGVGYFF